MRAGGIVAGDLDFTGFVAAADGLEANGDLNGVADGDEQREGADGGGKEVIEGGGDGGDGQRRKAVVVDGERQVNDGGDAGVAETAIVGDGGGEDGLLVEVGRKAAGVEAAPAGAGVPAGD